MWKTFRHQPEMLVAISYKWPEYLSMDELMAKLNSKTFLSYTFLAVSTSKNDLSRFFHDKSKLLEHD